MRKRLRKKRHLGEFQELGFTVWWRMKSIPDESECLQFLGRFLEEAIEANGLSFGGGGGSDSDEGEGFVANMGGGSATDEHRAIVQEWLTQDPDVAECRVEPLPDAWYGWKE